MSAGSILIGLLLVAATIPIVIKPLLNQKRRQPVPVGAPKVSASEQHQAALLALRDLEFDHRTGKVMDDDYANLRASLLAQAAATLDTKPKLADDLNSLIEDAVRQRRSQPVKSEAVNFCPKCGRKVQSDDRFCATCGATLTLAVRMN
jgi:hypothetical protein